jgi:two-component system, cell cycle response regulator DivK
VASERSAPAILLVDDDSDHLQIYASILSAHGYRVLEARTGAEALRVARARPLSLIIMDLKMPELDGWKAMELLRADPATRELPIVALTIVAADEDRRDPVRRGFDAHWVKPLGPGELLQRVRQWVGHPADGARRSE